MSEPPVPPAGRPVEVTATQSELLTCAARAVAEGRGPSMTLGGKLPDPPEGERYDDELPDIAVIVHVTLIPAENAAAFARDSTEAMVPAMQRYGIERFGTRTIAPAANDET